VSVVFKLGSIEPLGFDGTVLGVRRRSFESCNPFYFVLYWEKMGFDKSLENYVRVWCACKVKEPLFYVKSLF